MNEPKGFQALLEHFQVNKWCFQLDEPRRLINASFTARNSVYRSGAVVEPSDDVFHFFTFLPVLVPPLKRMAVAELCHRLSWGLRLGRFDLNFNDGTVRFVTSATYPKGELPRELIQQIITLNMSTMDYRLPAFMGVLYADRSPAEAAQLMPPPPKIEVGKQTQGSVPPSRIQFN